jgi:hypothetical protein
MQKTDGYGNKVMAAMTYEGNRFGLAWRMAVASYACCRRFPEVCGRWYSLCSAVEIWWDYLQRKRTPSPHGDAPQ